MGKNIMFITSDYTGHGHKSITQALCEHLGEVDPSLKISVINGFRLGGTLGSLLEKAYNPIVTHAPILWKVVYQLSEKCPSLLNAFTALNIKNRFETVIDENKPDIIVSVHGGFVGSVTKILEAKHLNIPVAVVVTDLVSISRIWADKRYEYILCPTQDAADRLERFGISKEKLRVIGFPIRKRFNDASQNSEPPASTMPPEGRSHFLIVATSFGTRYAKRMISLLLDMYDCTITILTGRDEKLKNALQQHFKSHILDRVRLPGYVNDVEKYLRGNDLLITRAGPNILMEAVSCQIPIVVTSYLPGQEEGNPAWIARQGLGVTCLDVNRLPQVVDSLLANDRFMMKKIRKAQQNYSAPRATYETALFLSKMANNR